MFILTAIQSTQVSLLGAFENRIDAEQQLKSAVRSWARQSQVMPEAALLKLLKLESELCAGYWLRPADGCFTLEEATAVEAGWFTNGSLAFKQLAEVRILESPAQQLKSRIESMEEQLLKSKNDLLELEYSRNFYQSGLRASSERLKTVEHELRCSENSLMERELELLVQHSKLDQQLTKAKKQLELQQSEQMDLRHTLATAGQSNARLVEQLADSERRLGLAIFESTMHQERVDELELQLYNEQMSNGLLNDELARSEQRNTDLQENNLGLAFDLANLAAEHKAVREELKKLA